MIDHQQRAMELFKQGYNCSQSVFASFSEDLSIDFETALKLSSSFGGGMGRLREVCGAVTAMFMIAGLKYGYTDPNDNDVKTAHYTLIQELASQFKAANDSIICRELLDLQENGPDSPISALRTEEFYKTRPCVELVGSGAKIIEEMIISMDKNEGKK